MKVLQILQRKGNNEVASITADVPVSDAANQLAEKKIGCLLVLDKSGALQGIVSERDIVRGLGESGGGCLNETVGSIMTSDVVTCAPEDDDNSVLGKMTSGRFRHLPVMKDGALAGLISIGDVVKARIDSLENENKELEDMIRSATA